MERAVKQMVEVGGGWVVVAADGTRTTFPTPIGARCADRLVSETAELFIEIEEAVRALGVTTGDPLLALQSLPFTSIPSLRMTFSGYANVLTRETVGLVPIK